MRISDWSSDVCSSDLKPSIAVLLLDHRRIRRPPPRSPPERRRSAHRETHTMSRIPLTPLDSAAREVPGLEVAVGWARPLATYFAIVSGEDEPGDEVLRVGGNRQHRIGRRLEQQVIDERLVVEGDRGAH